jgi:hypothetical protein
MGVVIRTQIAAIDAELARRPDSGPAQAGEAGAVEILPPAVRVAAGGLMRPPADQTEAQALFARARNERPRDPDQRPDAAIRTADSFPGVFPVSPHDWSRCPVRCRRATRPGRDRAWAVQEERERVPLGGGERGCCLGQLPDPGVQAATGVVCAVPVGVVTLVALGPVGQGAGARRVVVPVPVCRCGAGPLERMN